MINLSLRLLKPVSFLLAITVLVPFTVFSEQGIGRCKVVRKGGNQSILEDYGNFYELTMQPGETYTNLRGRNGSSQMVAIYVKRIEGLSDGKLALYLVGKDNVSLEIRMEKADEHNFKFTFEAIADNKSQGSREKLLPKDQSFWLVLKRIHDEFIGKWISDKTDVTIGSLEWPGLSLEQTGGITFKGNSQGFYRVLMEKEKTYVSLDPTVSGNSLKDQLK